MNHDLFEAGINFAVTVIEELTEKGLGIEEILLILRRKK